MADFPSVLENGLSASQQTREPTKVECGLLGALLATIVLGFLFWLGVQFSLLNLMISNPLIGKPPLEPTRHPEYGRATAGGSNGVRAGLAAARESSVRSRRSRHDAVPARSTRRAIDQRCTSDGPS